MTLPEMFDLWKIEESEIDAMDAPTLRKWAAARLPEYSQRRTVASFDLGSEVIGHPGALTALDKAVQTLRAAYGPDSKVGTRYGSGPIEVTVWERDDALRSSLKYRRKEAIKVAENADA
jgi:hypothetical protein